MVNAKESKSAGPAKPITIITPAELNKMEQERESAAAREALEKKRKEPAPVELYTEGDLVVITAGTAVNIAGSTNVIKVATV